MLRQGRFALLRFAQIRMHCQVKIGVAVLDRQKFGFNRYLHVEFFSNLADDGLLFRFTGFHFTAGEFPFFGDVGVFGRAALDGEDFVLVLDDGCYDLDVFHGGKDIVLGMNVLHVGCSLDQFTSAQFDGF